MRELIKKICWRGVLLVLVFGTVFFSVNYNSRPQGAAVLFIQALIGGCGLALACLLGSLWNRRYGYGAAALMFACDLCRIVRDPEGIRFFFYFLPVLSAAAALIIFTPPKQRWLHWCWSWFFRVAAFVPLLLSAWTLKGMIELRFHFGIPLNLLAGGALLLALSAASAFRFHGVKTVDRNIIIAGCCGCVLMIRQLMLVESVY